MGTNKFVLAILSVMVFLFGAYFGITTLIKNIASETTKNDFNQMMAEDFEEGQFVKGNVYLLIDEYAADELTIEKNGTTDKQITNRYYLAMLENYADSDIPMYITIDLGTKDKYQEANELIDQTWSYMDTGVEPEEWNRFTLYGEVQKLDKELEDMLYEYLLYGTEGITREQVSQFVCPYVISQYNYKGDFTNSIVFLCIGAVGLGGIVGIIIHTAKQKKKERQASAAMAQNNCNNFVPTMAESNPQSGFTSYAPQQTGTAQPSDTNNQNTSGGVNLNK